MHTVTITEIIAQGKDTAHAAPVGVSAEALDAVRAGDIFAQQGDIYIGKLSRLPKTATRDMQATGQLAPGTTQGSRHCVDITRVRLWVLPTPTALQGPIIEAPEGVEIFHPEHGNIVLPPGVYQVSFQRAYADELRRVAD